MIAVISAVIAVLGAVFTAVLGHRLQVQAKSLDRRDYMSRYRDALLWTAFDLQSRIYNILRGYQADLRGMKGFTSSFLLAGTEQQAHYVKRSTAFLFAEYLGWAEIFRRDLQFLDLGSNRANQQIMFTLNRISRTLGDVEHTPGAECFRIFRTDQRAVGEIMIDPDSEPGERRCIGYATFCAQLTAEDAFSEWMQEILDHVELAAREPDQARDRLARIQHQLIDLIDLLDAEGRRFPSAERSRFAPTE
ncbi:hypothetical protein [Streptomyces sp. GESEQ-4]|uniref:hypothetical protein n=1 Tax=Streptomyces sp. GESEQ-4 TaxID=2812655 RepID=UPI001B333F32|nr:hypothetical protein [Streptomyces sp. GESEQ-4]